MLLFSGGKDSIVLLRLAEKAFRPGELPFPVMHVDTGHNFPEAIEFRDRHVPDVLVASVQESIDRGRVRDAPSRNRLQTTTLLDAIEEHRFDAAFGGARRDEERARAKERIFSFRDDFGQWDPRRQRPELWNLYNGRVRPGEHVRVFPISNWTELDVWEYIRTEDLEIPSIYFAHEREVFERDGMIYAASDFLPLRDGEPVVHRVGALPHGGRHDVHGRGALGGGDARRRDRRDRRHADLGARRDARGRPTSARPRWRTASARATSSGAEIACACRGPAPQLLRFATAGSVDDGKSTLIGRLLYDSKSLLADQVADAELDLARLTDGLRAEREQGITIDVAYRHFSTPRRRFIIADTPGHAQYTRNMVTGASTADVAVVLVDAREGLLTQSRRHAAIAGLLGIPRIVLAVNKMDLVDYDADRFRAICADFRAWAGRLEVEEITCIPISALEGRQRRRALGGDGLVPRADAARVPRERAGGRRAGGGAAAAAGPVRDPRRRAARLRGPARRRERARGRRGRGPAGRADLARDGRRGPGRAAGVGERAAVGRRVARGRAGRRAAAR